MANFLGDINPIPVPVPRATRPLEIPQIQDSADLILRAAEQSQAAQFHERQLRQKAIEGIGETISTVFNLRNKKRELDIQEKKDEAMIDLLKKKEKREADELAWKTGGGGPEGKVSAEAAFGQSKVKEAVRLIPDIKVRLLDKTGNVDKQIAAELSSWNFAGPLSQKAQEADAALGKLLEIDVYRITGAAATPEQVRNLKKQMYPSLVKQGGALKYTLGNMEKVYGDLDSVFSSRVIPERKKPDLPPVMAAAMGEKMSRRDALSSLKAKGLSKDKALKELNRMISAGEVE